MVSSNDIFKAVVREFHKIKPEYKNYYGNISEEFQRPSFLYELVFHEAKRTSFFSINKRLTIQVVVFVPVESTGVSRLRNELGVVEELEGFLASGNLKVGSRHLNFNYSIENADEEIAVKLEFEYLDNASTPEFDKQQAWELMWHINLKQEVNANG